MSAALTSLPEPIHEGQEGEEEEEEEEEEDNEIETKHDIDQESVDPPAPLSVGPSDTQHTKSLKMFSEMKALAANLSTSPCLQSLTGSTIDIDQPTVRSHRSIWQRELLLC